MKTIKEAYESVGLKPEVGDTLGDIHTIRFVDGWYFDNEKERPPSTMNCCVYSAKKYVLNEQCLPIRRNGRQIYPENKLESEKIMQEFRSNHSTILSDLINRLIDAKIKEAKNDKV